MNPPIEVNIQNTYFYEIFLTKYTGNLLLHVYLCFLYFSRFIPWKIDFVIQLAL